MNTSFFVKIIGRWIFCIPLFLAGVLTAMLPFIVNPALPAYFFHKGWILTLAGCSLASSVANARRHYARYKSLNAAWKDAAGTPPRSKKTKDTVQRPGWINWPVAIVMGACLFMTYYLLTATLALIQSNNGLLPILRAGWNNNDYLLAWLIWPLAFAFEVYLLYRVFNRLLAHWTSTQTQWLLIPATLLTGGLFLALIAASTADECLLYLLAFVAISAVTLAIYFPARRKRVEKARAENVVIDGRNVPETLVSVNLAVPKDSPRPALILPELPDYCMNLLRFQKEASYPDMQPRDLSRSGDVQLRSRFEQLESFEIKLEKAKAFVQHVSKHKGAALSAIAAIGITVAILTRPAQPSPAGSETKPALAQSPSPVRAAPPLQAISDTTRVSAAPGLTPAQTTQLGRDYLSGTNGLAENKAEAARLFQIAADHGDAEAQTQLGLMYMAGDGGLPRSDSEAIKWFAKAATQGNAESETMVGFMYENGAGGLPQSDEEAVGWYTRAAQQGQPSSQTFLGLMYESGRGGLTRSDNDAVRWYREAAQRGNPESQMRLGYMYETGRGGLSQSADDAVQWYRKAAAKGNAKAQALLGAMYLSGDGGLPQDSEAGMSLFKQAARQGEPSAQAFLQKFHVSWNE